MRTKKKNSAAFRCGSELLVSVLQPYAVSERFGICDGAW